MAKTILKEQVTHQGPFAMLLNLLTSKSMQMIESKENGEKAITIRVPPATAERLDTYAKAARISRSFLIRILLEGALDEMDDLVVEEEERQERELEHQSAMAEEIDREKREKEQRARALLEKWQSE